MVDFNADATVSASAIDILRILILQRRNDVIDSLEAFNRIGSHSTQPDTSVIKARLLSMFMEIQAMLKRKLTEINKITGKTKYEDLREKVSSDNYDLLLESFIIMNEFLDENRLTRIDTKQVYDSTRVNSEDQEKGL